MAGKNKGGKRMDGAKAPVKRSSAHVVKPNGNPC